MKPIIFVTGASGAGKTTAVKILENRGESGTENNTGKIVFCYFDSIGVPSSEDMVRDYGSGEGWQKAKTIEWVKKIKEEFLSNGAGGNGTKDKSIRAVILDGQVRQTFIEEACTAVGIENYKIVLFDCTDEVRNQRLVDRGHPELMNQDMLNWAKYLREQAILRGDSIIDTSNLEIDGMADTLAGLIR